MSRHAQAVRRAARLLLVALIALTGARCATDSITAPSGSTLSLSTPARSVSVNGTAVLTAQLLGNGGEPQVGAAIAFSTSLGTVEPAEAVTNASGQVTVVFSAGNASGTAVIRAASGSVQATPVSLVVGTAAVGRVTLTASPAAVPFNGGTTTLTALVIDGGGNPLAAMPVAFSATAGTLTPANAKTDGNGLVQAALSTTATTIVTAVAGVSPGDQGAPSGPTLVGTLTVALAQRPSPVVSIAAGASPVAGTAVTFTIGATPAAGSNATIQSVAVSFGDGSGANLGAVSGTAIVAQHLYTEGGTYTASVTATDSGGATSTASTVIVVAASAPLAVSVVAGPMVPAGGGPNAIVTLTASVLPATAVINSYLWDFGDGTPPQASTAAQVQHVFARAALYTVSVTVTEAVTGLTATGSAPLSTASGMPTVAVTPPANPVAGRPLTFTIAAAVAAGSNAAMRTVVIDFGDGTSRDLGPVTGSAINATHAYAAAGSFLVRVTATDSAGGVGVATTQIVVGSAAGPTVAVSASSNAIAGSPVTLTITAAPEAGSNTTITAVSVDFGDGTAPVALGPVSGTATTQHTYTVANTYTVSVSATDSSQQTVTTSTQVVVAAPGGPTVSIAASTNAMAGTAVVFTITAAAAANSGATIAGVTIAFETNGATVNLGAINGTTTTQHVYAAAGTYTATVVATDSGGRTATAATQVVIAPRPLPTVTIAVTGSAVAGAATSFSITTTPAPGVTAPIQSVVVDFGDAAPPANLGALTGAGTTQHVYAGAGSFEATATVTDLLGGTGTATTSVVVAAPVVVALIASGSPIACLPTALTATATLASGFTVQTLILQDGVGGQTSGTSSPVTTARTYGSTGTFTASAIATVIGSGNVAVQVSTNLSVVVGACPVLQHTFTATAFDQDTLFRWPGSQQTYTLMPGLSVTIQTPSGTISNLSGDTWGIAATNGYSAARCTITPQEPDCTTVGSSSSLQSNGRPYCSNASVVFSSGAPTARAAVQCTYP